MSRTSKWELEALRREIDSKASREEVGVALSRKLEASIFMAHVRSCNGGSGGQQGTPAAAGGSAAAAAGSSSYTLGGA